MNYSEVKSLLDAGFTVDEIRGMMGSNPQNPQDFPQPEPEQPEQQPEPDKEAQPVLQPTPEQEEKFSQLSQLSQSIEKLIKTIQVSNLQNRSFDTPATPDINKQVDNIMAGIIRPEHEKQKEV